MKRTLTLTLSAAGAVLLMACSPENQLPASEELGETIDADAPLGEEDVAPLPDVTPDVAPPVEDAEDDDAEAAALPTTDIYLADLGWTGSVPAITNVRNATQHAGYDNQPAFLPGSRDFLYSAETPSGLTDVHVMRSDRTVEQITGTPDSGEYSPRAFDEGSGIYFVRQASDGTTQHLVHAGMDGSNPEPVLDLTTIGYYAFSADRSQVALFVLGDPFTLQVADLESGAVSTVAAGVGRALYAEPGADAALFTTGNEEEGYLLNRHDFATGETVELFALPGLTQDFAVHRMGDGTLVFLASDEGTLYSRTADTDWTAVADLGGMMLDDITRMAVSDDGSTLAIVAADRAY